MLEDAEREVEDLELAAGLLRHPACVDPASVRPPTTDCYRHFLKEGG